jgi:hypothetical protein
MDKQPIYADLEAEPKIDKDNLPDLASSFALLCADTPVACRGIGRQPIYVDLEADPKIDKDNPPDLKQYADSTEPPPKEEEGPSSSNSAAQPAGAAAAGAAAAAGGKGGKAGKAAAGAAAKGKAKMSNDAHHIQLTNVVQRTGDLVDMVSWRGFFLRLLVFCSGYAPRHR